MSIFQALILGIVQGATEFIPVSSSGHLVIFPHLLGWAEQPLVFDTTMHLATALALIVCFWKDIYSILRSLMLDICSPNKRSLKEYSPNSLLAINIIVGSIPVALIGYLLGNTIESNFRGLWYVIAFLILGSILMFIGERVFFKKLLVEDEISLSKGIGVGLFQVLSLFPGISRSGSTIAGGMIFGINRKDATRFSFLLSIPVVLMAGLYNISKSGWATLGVDLPVLVCGFISAFVVGMVSIKFLMAFVRRNTLYPFIIYRILLAALLLFLIIR